MKLSANRLLDKPMIQANMDDRMGDNINGPSLVRVPEWVENPLGKYYLYFAHHKGRFIRMAYADVITGPWSIYSPGVLDVKDSFFVSNDLTADDPSLADNSSSHFNSDFLYAHVASPDVHIDHDNRQLIMYFHGLLEDSDQQTRLASSTDGLSFVAEEPLLGAAYFRAFRYLDHVYAISWGGEIWRSGSWRGEFEKGTALLPDPPVDGADKIFRHGEVHVVGEQLLVLYSSIGDCPERVKYVEVTLSPDWSDWQVSEPLELIKPELEWEGFQCPLVPSRVGASEQWVHELRDPCMFTDDDGKQYLLYAAAGESAIGLAELTMS